MADTTIKYKQLYDEGEPFYPVVGKSSYNQWLGYKEVSGDPPTEGFVTPITNGGTGAGNVNDARENFGFGSIQSQSDTVNVSANTDTVLVTFSNLKKNTWYLVSGETMASFNTSSNRVWLYWSGSTNGTALNNMNDTWLTGWHWYALSGLINSGDSGVITLSVNSQVAGAFRCNAYIMQVS